MRHLPFYCSVILWLGFLICWFWPRGKRKASDKAESLLSRCFHLGLFYSALLTALVTRIRPLDWRWLPDTAIYGYVGLAIQSACILLAVWARQHLGESWSSKVLVASGQRLIDTGPYRKVRHPIYTSILGMFVATAIVNGELHGLIAIFIMAVAYWRKIQVEERLLVWELRDKYEGYRRRTWALIPCLI